MFLYTISFSLCLKQHKIGERLRCGYNIVFQINIHAFFYKNTLYKNGQNISTGKQQAFCLEQ